MPTIIPDNGLVLLATDGTRSIMIEDGGCRVGYEIDHLKVGALLVDEVPHKIQFPSACLEVLESPLLLESCQSLYLL